MRQVLSSGARSIEQHASFLSQHLSHSAQHPIQLSCCGGVWWLLDRQFVVDIEMTDFSPSPIAGEPLEIKPLNLTLTPLALGSGSRLASMQLPQLPYSSIVHSSMHAKPLPSGKVPSCHCVLL